MKKIIRLFLTSFFIIIICIATFFGILYLGGFGPIPSQKALKNIQNETASLVYDDQGVLIGKYFSQNRTNVPIKQLPPHLINALIATEDARFYKHNGFDQKSMLRVMVKTILMGDKSAGGGSTISQQLAKNLFGRKSYGKISIVVNKLKEIILARRIENVYHKDEILELYLNTVPFGENVFGIQAAAKRFFSKNAADLKIEEAAVLVGLLKANSYYNPRKNPENAKKRRNVVLFQMQQYKYLTKPKLDSLQNLPLTLSYLNLNKENLAPYFLSKVKKEVQSILKEISTDENKYDLEKDGLRIYTSLNVKLQQEARKSLEKQLHKFQQLLKAQYNRQPFKKDLETLVRKVAKQNGINLENSKKQNRFLFQWRDSTEYRQANLSDSLKHVLLQLHAGVLAINPKSGAIKTYVGGINYQHYPYDQIQAKRQMASTFKPILYACALESGSELCDFLSNEPVRLEDYEGWSPENYDGKSGGKYSLAASLALSKNIPTLHLYFRVYGDSLANLWNKIGFIEDLNQEPSAIYGTNSVSLLELASAYSVFSNLGYSISPYCIERIETAEGEVLYEHKVTPPTKILSVETSKKINEALILAATSGTGQALKNQFGIQSEWASKTGTSQNYSDAWFVCYNSDLVMLSRVGASYPSIHFSKGAYGSASRLALPIVAEAIKHSKQESWYTSGLQHSNDINCDGFQEERDIDKVLNLFKKDEKTLEQAKSKAQRKEKRKGLFKKLFGK